MIVAAVAAVFRLSAPEAIGLRDFTGCTRSRSRSARSFTTYTTPDSAQKIKKAAVAFAVAAGSSNLTAKISAAKTMRFLVH